MKNIRYSFIIMALMLLAVSIVSAQEPTNSAGDADVTGFSAAGDAALTNALGGDVITFDEFATGTPISTQYATRGIIFGGDSPFIANDGAHATTPVLSGSPLFQGDITGTFVDPADGTTPRTVSAFRFSAGYFNAVNSTRIEWFDADGNLIDSRLNSQIGIETITVNGTGIASFRIGIIGNEIAGYTIDNVTFMLEDPSPFPANDVTACWLTDQNNASSVWIIMNHNPVPVFPGTQAKVRFNVFVYRDPATLIQSMFNHDNRGNFRLNTPIADYIVVEYFIWDNGVVTDLQTITVNKPEDRCGA